MDNKQILVKLQSLKTLTGEISAHFGSLYDLLDQPKTRNKLNVKTRVQSDDDVKPKVVLGLPKTLLPSKKSMNRLFKSSKRSLIL